MPARRPVIALTAVALAFRLSTLGVQSFWSDEAATAIVLDHSFGGMLRAIWDGESTPPLFYVVDWLWSQVAGTGEVALRLPSALLSTATVPVAAALAARLRPSSPGPAATLTALLVAVSPLAVWYGQEARAYALLMLLTTASTLALLRAVEDPTRGRLAAWAGLATLSFWSHHFALFLVVGQGLWLLRVLRTRALVAVGAVAAGAAALAPLLLHQRDAGRAVFIDTVPVLTRIAQVPKQVLVGYDGPAEALLVVLAGAATAVALGGLVALLAAARPRREATPAAVVTGVVLLGCLLPVLAAAIGQDFLLTRNLLGALPPVLALLGAGLARLWDTPRRRALAATAAAALAGVGVVSAVAVATDRSYQRDNFRGAIDALLAGPPHARLVIADAASSVPARFYLGKDAKVVIPGTGYPVTELDVVLVAGAQPGRRRSTPVIPPDPPLPGGFAAAGEDRGQTWAVRRWVSPQPVAVDPASVYGLNPRGNAIAFFRPR